MLLGQVTAAGVGLNLQAASVVIFMEPQFKPSTEDQAIARAHRMGQTEVVMVHRLLAVDTVDQRVRALFAEKRRRMDLFSNESLLKDASPEATRLEPESKFATEVIAAEQERLRARTGAGVAPSVAEVEPG